MKAPFAPGVRDGNLPRMRTLFGVLAIALLLAMHLGAAQAQDCNPRAGGNAVTGTLTAPQPPCRPAPRAQTTEPAQKPARERGAFRDGNFSVYVGGSVSTQSTIRGR